MKKLLAILLVLIILAVAGVFVARYVLIGYANPDFLVRQMEQTWNCRAQVDSIEVRLFGNTGVELQGVALAQRDEYADKGTPLGERPRLESTELSSSKVVLEVAPGDLLKRRLNISQLIVEDLTVDTRILTDGTSTMERLFDPPANPAPDKATDPEVEVNLAETPEPAVKEEPAAIAAELEEVDTVSADDLAMSLMAGIVEIRNGNLKAKLESSGSLLQIENLNLKLTDIDVDPKKLAGHNQANFIFDGNLFLDSRDAATRYINMAVKGSGTLNPFDVHTGNADPSWVCDLIIAKDSELNTFPILEKLQAALDKLDTEGVDLSGITLRGTLLKDAETRLVREDGRLRLDKDLPLALPDTDLVFLNGSWLESGSNQHQLEGVVKASEELTHKIEEKVDAYLKKKAKAIASPEVRAMILSPAMEDGRISLHFVSQGDMGNPKADIMTPFGNLSTVIEEGKRAINDIKDALKGLFK